MNRPSLYAAPISEPGAMPELYRSEQRDIMGQRGKDDHEVENLVRGEEIIKCPRRQAFWYTIGAITQVKTPKRISFKLERGTHYSKAPPMYNTPSNII